MFEASSKSHQNRSVHKISNLASSVLEYKNDSLIKKNIWSPEMPKILHIHLVVCFGIVREMQIVVENVQTGHTKRKFFAEAESDTLRSLGLSCTLLCWRGSGDLFSGAWDNDDISNKHGGCRLKSDKITYSQNLTLNYCLRTYVSSSRSVRNELIVMSFVINWVTWHNSSVSILHTFLSDYTFSRSRVKNKTFQSCESKEISFDFNVLRNLRWEFPYWKYLST